MSFLEQYYVYTNEYTENISQTIVLMQCGAFLRFMVKKMIKEI